MFRHSNPPLKCALRSVVFSIGCLLLSACHSVSVLTQARIDEAMRVVYVIDHGLHTGIAVEADLALKKIAGLPFSDREVTLIEFGWGDRAFYQAESFSLGLALKALFVPSDSVMHVAGLRREPSDYFRHGGIERIRVPESRLIAMLAAIDGSFERDGQGRLNRLGRGLYAYSAFYGANGRYHVFNNCNTWTIDTLSAAGVVSENATAFTASGVMRLVGRYRERQPVSD